MNNHSQLSPLLQSQDPATIPTQIEESRRQLFSNLQDLNPNKVETAKEIQKQFVDFCTTKVCFSM